MIHMRSEILTATAEEMRLSRTRRPGDLLTLAMAEIVDQAVTHQEDCYLCEGFMSDECTIFINGVTLAAAWRVANVLERA